MPISKPMEVVAIRFTPEEKLRLQAIAKEQHVTLSHAVREGAKLYLQDARDALGSHRVDVG